MGKFLDKIKKYKNSILFVLSLIILVYFCTINNNLICLCKVLPFLNLYWLIGGFFALLISWYFESRVIATIAQNLNSGKISNRFFYKTIVYSQYFSAITPMGIGYQPAQILKLKEKGITTENAVVILTKKLLIYQTTLAIYSIITSIIYYDQLKNSFPGLILFIAIGVFFQCFTVLLLMILKFESRFVLKAAKRVIFICAKIKLIKNPEKTIISFNRKIKSILECNVKLGGKTSLKLYLFNFLQITFLLSIPFFVFKSFNHEFNPIIETICTQSVVNTVSSFTPLPGSSGTTENGFLKMFSLIFSKEEISVAMIICRFISFYFVVIIGALFKKIK